MCVLAFAWKPHPRWRLVAAGNRDELHDRPAAALARWERPAGVIAGRDLQSGGTWMGVSERSGRFAVVTNLRGHGPPAADRESRGSLVTDLLAGDGRHGDPDRTELDAFNPFNLILAGDDEALFLSNRPEPVRSRLAPGLYGLSNGALDEPWPKTLRLKAILLDWIVREETGFEPLLAGLREERLPEFGIGPLVPSDAPLEPTLSPVFIRHPVYGTRCSTVVAVDSEGRGTIFERRYDAAGEAVGETAVPFAWDA